MQRTSLAILLGLALGCHGSTPGPGGSKAGPGAGTATASAAQAAGTSGAAEIEPAPTASGSASAAELPADDAALALAPEDQQRIGAAVQGAIERGEIPGAVVLLIARGRVVFHRAYGLRAKEPRPVAMTEDTVFDLASLTKPVATATSIALLAERGRLRFSDPASAHLPAFAANGKAAITIEQLLLHTSGLPADNAVSEYAGGRDAAIGRVLAMPLERPPGEAFRYSDLGYLVLGEIVARASSAGSDAFAHDRLFGPLGMADTLFTPPASLAPRVAPTERIGDSFLLGTVHDPRARALGGIAGHAGLFSTARDLGRFAQMLLGGGALGGTRVLAESTVRALLSPRPIPAAATAQATASAQAKATAQATATAQAAADRRAYLGWVKGTAVMHTGFTGTALWVDPQRKIAVVVLSNRVHPDGKGSAERLRREVFEACAAGAARLPEAPVVETGIDVLAASGLEALRGHRVALLTHAAGRTRDGKSTVDVLAHAPSVKLVSLLSPEHGLRSTEDGNVADEKDARTGLPIHSLYGASKRPTKAMLEGADTIVVDLQDAGVRFYTYETTLGYTLEAAAQMGVRVVVLDRPNPIGGVKIEGPILDAGRESFVGYHRVPVRHGMTLGELALLFNAERKIGASLDVVKMRGWTRGELFEGTGLAWTPPSPSLLRPAAALLYPGVGLVELTNVSVGRGTPRPFEQLGAPWIDGAKLAAALRDAGVRGVAIERASFTPSSSAFAGQKCDGVSLAVTEPNELDSVRLGLAIAVALRRLFPEAWRPSGLLTLLGHQRAYDAVAAGEPLDRVLATFTGDAAAFAERRKPYLLYGASL